VALPVVFLHPAVPAVTVLLGRLLARAVTERPDRTRSADPRSPAGRPWSRGRPPEAGVSRTVAPDDRSLRRSTTLVPFESTAVVVTP